MEPQTGATVGADASAVKHAALCVYASVRPCV